MNSKNIKKLMKLKYNYPEVNDENLQSKIYNKREFYYHKIPNRKIAKNYEKLKNIEMKYVDKSFIYIISNLFKKLY